jgi:hypothetical protein
MGLSGSENLGVSMTSTDMITLLASMTSTASLASKNQKLLALYILSDFPGIRNLNILNNLSDLNDLNSLISLKQLLGLMFPSTLTPKTHILVSQFRMYHQILTILLIFGTISVGGCRGHPMRWKLTLKG